MRHRTPSLPGTTPPGERSCLSLFIVSKELKPYVKSLYIDSAGVARPVWEKGNLYIRLGQS